MAALLHVDTLRRHASSSAAIAAMGRDRARPVLRIESMRLAVKPQLVASWRIGPDRHLTCFWAMQRIGDAHPPPD